MKMKKIKILCILLSTLIFTSFASAEVEYEGSRINTNVSSVMAQNNLKNTNEKLQTSGTRATTGVKTNSAVALPKQASGHASQSVSSNVARVADNATSAKQTASGSVNVAGTPKSPGTANVAGTPKSPGTAHVAAKPSATRTTGTISTQNNTAARKQ